MSRGMFGTTDYTRVSNEMVFNVSIVKGMTGESYSCIKCRRFFTESKFKNKKEILSQFLIFNYLEKYNMSLYFSLNFFKKYNWYEKNKYIYVRMT